MKRVTLAVRGTDDPIHPLVPFLTSDAVDRAAMVDWNAVTRTDGPDESTVVLRVHADPERVRETFDSAGIIDSFELSVFGDRTCFVQAHSETAALEGATAKALTPPGVVAVPPLEYGDDGWVVLTVVGDDGAVQSAVDDVPESVEVDVRSVTAQGYTDAAEPLAALTDRQREAVAAAVAVGYYDTPRTAGVEAVAEELDCAPSTAAEHLRKAESRLVTELVARAGLA
jgi:hypothetical protein